MSYNFLEIERRWQERWEAERTYTIANPGEPGFDSLKPKFYILDMFPYPSGTGLHVGHPLGYIGTDILARYKRMRGFNVLHPMGYDAFGLPAENFAVEHGVHPSITTKQNINNITRQLRRLGLSYDWDRTLSTTDPEFYRWTQWAFLKMFNAWFDPWKRKARPIKELVSSLESGALTVGVDGTISSGAEGPLNSDRRNWQSLSVQEKRETLDAQRLAYMAELPVNWCPMLGTVLANEEVTNEGRSERGNYPVYRRPLRQWMLRITAYADRLIEDLRLVDWPEPIKLMQENWVGRSSGAYVQFDVRPDTSVEVFTTRPDTLFGATYVVLAPEHPLVGSLVTDPQRATVNAYQREVESKLDVDRISTAVEEKTGVFTGAYATNPVNGQQIPIWVADYVLMGYGTGAIMAVPAHDDRDFAFARKFSLPIRAVVLPDDSFLRANAPLDAPPTADLRALYLDNAGRFQVAFVGDGRCIQSSSEGVSLNGLQTSDAKEKIIEWLEQALSGRRAVQYKLRDWLFSRQRYWGEPFPVLHGPDGSIVPLDDSELPVVLPEMIDFTPEATNDPDAPPVPPLSRAPGTWRFVLRNGVKYARELNTMPQWAGSCWYYLRYIDPRNNEALVDRKAEAYWMAPSVDNKAGGVDLYIGGTEHAVLHLLYARFWHKVLYDLGFVSTCEPFGRLFNQGYILAPSYQDSRGIYVPANEVEEGLGGYFYKDEPVTRKMGKMGKSLKNAVSPDEIIQEFGCDTLRLYEMYLGPLDQSKPWRTQDILGVHRFLQRLWRLLIDEENDAVLVSDRTPDDAIHQLTHKTIKRVTDAMESLTFNVGIAALIELNNELVKRSGDGERVSRETAETMLHLLSPMAPHLSQELWTRLGNGDDLTKNSWPTYSRALLVEEETEYVIAINGKVRHRLSVPAQYREPQVEAAVMADPRVTELTKGRKPARIVVVAGRMVNLVYN
jgi:leucyl-tRNA synthetase